MSHSPSDHRENKKALLSHFLIVIILLGTMQPQIASDGAGGAIITWQDYRTGGTSDIYAQRVNGNGIPQWTANEVAICTAINRQQDPQIVSDGSHGAIITWEDSRFLMYGDIDVQRVSAAGTCLWTADGAPIGRYGETHLVPRIISDGAGGGIIGWLNRRDLVSMWDIYAQRIDPGGTMLRYGVSADQRTGCAHSICSGS